MPLASSLRGIASFPRYLVSRRARRDTDSQFTIDVKVSVPARARGRVLLDERVFDQPISPSDEQLLIVRRVERDAPIVTVLDESDEDASRQAELARLRPRIEVASRTEEDDLLDHQQRLSDGHITLEHLALAQAGGPASQSRAPPALAAALRPSAALLRCGGSRCSASVAKMSRSAARLAAHPTWPRAISPAAGGCTQASAHSKTPRP